MSLSTGNDGLPSTGKDGLKDRFVFHHFSTLPSRLFVLQAEDLAVRGLAQEAASRALDAEMLSPGGVVVASQSCSP